MPSNWWDEDAAGSAVKPAAALWYARNGLPVFPLHAVDRGACTCGTPDCQPRGKHPRTRHGFKDATSDVDQVAEWWLEWPSSNIGLPTGRSSGLLALDVDPRNGGDESWVALMEACGSLPHTAEQTTGGGGKHIIFKDPGVAVRKILAPGIDVKGEGGYIVVAPSIHATGQLYKWCGTGPELLLSPAELPSWLMERLNDSGQAQTGAACGEVKLQRGQRNTNLTSFAGRLRRRGMSEASILRALLQENAQHCDPPLEESEVAQIAKSIARYRPQSEGDHATQSMPFRATNDGVFHSSGPGNDDLKICGRLDVVAQTCDVGGNGWGRLLRWPDRQGQLHEWAMPMSMLAGDGSECRAHLMDGGLVISPLRKARELLHTYIQTAPTAEHVLCVSRVGWNGNCFVLPDHAIGSSDGGRTVFQSNRPSDHLLNVAGSIEEWRANVGSLCSGNSRLIFAVSCALVGPLLKLADAESGGVHFVGPSSTGKSTALLVGGSVLGGGPRTGFVQSWRATVNGLEATADLHNDLTLFLDELAQVDPQQAAEVAYLLANGRGKSRMSKNLALHKPLTWSLLFVSAGELTLSEHAQTAGKRLRTGAEVRLLNISSDAGANLGIFENLHHFDSPDEFARSLKSAALKYYGAPLRAWLAFVANDRERVRQAITNFQSDFLRDCLPKGESGEVIRAAERFALIAAAGELATEAGITGWRENDAIGASVTCFHSWLGRRRTTAAGDASRAIAQVRQYLKANGTSRFQLIGASRASVSNGDAQAGAPVSSRAGFRRCDPTTGEIEFLIFREIFQAEVCSGLDHQAVCKYLADAGYLRREGNHWTVKPRRLPDLTPGTRVYAIRGAILGSEE